MAEPYTDLQLPKPLLNPDGWEKPASHSVSIVSIAQIAMGGPVETLWLKVSERMGRLPIAAPENFWSGAVSSELSLAVIAAEKFRHVTVPVEIVSRAELSASEKTDWKKLSPTITFKTMPHLRELRLADWSHEVFPSAFIEAGEPVWRKQLIDYEKQIVPSFVSMDALRFLPGFLKSKKQPFAATAAREWAYAQTLFSPQDDRQGEGETALLNPTLNVFEHENSLKAFWRAGGRVESADLNWQEAAVVDELREDPRVSFARLRAELEAKKFPFKEKPDFESVLSSLSGRGLILRR